MLAAEMARDGELWREAVRRVAVRIGGKGDAEELVQGAWLRMADYRVTRPVHNPAAFLVRTAVNIYRDHWRHESKWMDRSAELESRMDSSPLPDRILAGRERLERVQAGIARLPPRTRQIFLMQRVNGLAYGEIARRMGISQSAVEKHISRALSFLINWSQDW
jgi:RNA polymerase sigma-70 factor (ECF subfamily)